MRCFFVTILKLMWYFYHSSRWRLRVPCQLVCDIWFCLTLMTEMTISNHLKLHCAVLFHLQMTLFPSVKPSQKAVLMKVIKNHNWKMRQNLSPTYAFFYCVHLYTQLVSNVCFSYFHRQVIPHHKQTCGLATSLWR